MSIHHRRPAARPLVDPRRRPRPVARDARLRFVDPRPALSIRGDDRDRRPAAPAMSIRGDDRDPWRPKYRPEQ
jgi:hypothetical protein